MSDNSDIEWTDATWNPVTGCTKVGEGCRNCYAERFVHRFPARFGGADHPFKPTLHPDRLDQPLRWKKPRRIFVCSMGDLFHPDVPYEYAQRVFSVMEQAKHHTFQVLTKRPDRMREFVSGSWDEATEEAGEIGWYTPSSHIWLGVSAWDQESAEKMIPTLLATPAAVRFVSLEPLLGTVALTEIYHGADRTIPRDYWDSDTDDDPPAMAINALTGLRWQYFGRYEEQVERLDWVIVGGESGPGARRIPSPGVVRDIRDQCADAGVPFFFKQWGEWGYYETDEEIGFERVGKKKAGRLLDGVEHNEFPRGRR